MYIKKHVDCVEIDNDEDDTVKRLWVKTGGKSTGQTSWWESVTDPLTRTVR